MLSFHLIVLNKRKKKKNTDLENVKTSVWPVKSTRLIHDPDRYLAQRKHNIMGDIDELNLVYEMVYEDNLDMLDNLSMESMNMSTEEESWDATVDM